MSEASILANAADMKASHLLRFKRGANDDVVYGYALKHHEDFSERPTECTYL